MAADNQEIVLITGGNTGLGLEIARKLLRDHDSRFHVLIGCRTPSKGEAAVKELHGQGLRSCEVIEIDLVDDSSIAKAAKTVEQRFGRLDVLLANAGIAPEAWMQGEPLSKMIMTAMQTNVAGTAQSAEAFVPLLQKSPNPRLIFMSSGLGSLDRCRKQTHPNTTWPAYSSTKAALNMIMLWFYHRYPDITVNSCCPGLRGTNLNGFGSLAPDGITPGKLEDGANNAVRLALGEKDAEGGTFTQMDDATGDVVMLPW